MSRENTEFRLPVNIITGFLGAGKTSSILHFMEQKPPEETWAILVNEFGEIGVDGSLIQGCSKEGDRILIFEVPGGCMCCAAGLSMQMALSQILFLIKPDRLLVEPTGLGHPAEVLETLSSDSYRDQLKIEKTITLVDAGTIFEERYRDHPSFIQQLNVADLVVINKTDLCSEGELNSLTKRLYDHCSALTKILHTQQGKIDRHHLNGTTCWVSVPDELHEEQPNLVLAADLPIPDCGYLKATNTGEGFHSVGWRFSANKVFNYSKLLSFLSGLRVDRMKAVFITEKGIFGYNLASAVLSEIVIDECVETKVEIITNQADPKWESQLLSCLVSG